MAHPDASKLTIESQLRRVTNDKSTEANVIRSFTTKFDQLELESNKMTGTGTETETEIKNDPKSGPKST